MKTARQQKLPPLGLRDSTWFTSGNAGWRLSSVTGLARSASISNLLALLHHYPGYLFFPKGMIVILSYHKGIRRADLYTFAAAVTLIGINGDIPVTRTIFETVIRYHLFSKLSERSLPFHSPSWRSQTWPRLTHRRSAFQRVLYRASLF